MMTSFPSDKRISAKFLYLLLTWIRNSFMEHRKGEWSYTVAVKGRITRMIKALEKTERIILKLREPTRVTNLSDKKVNSIKDFDWEKNFYMGDDVEKKLKRLIHKKYMGEFKKAKHTGRSKKEYIDLEKQSLPEDYKNFLMSICILNHSLEDLRDSYNNPRAAVEIDRYIREFEKFDKDVTRRVII